MIFPANDEREKMTPQQKFKSTYSKVRRMWAEAYKRAQGLPCGADDALFERVGHAVDDICRDNPAIGYVLESRYDSDPLETPLQWRYAR